MKRLILIWVFLLPFVGVQAQDTSSEIVPGSILESTFVETQPAEAINAVINHFYDVEERVPADYDVDIYHIVLQSTDEQGEAIPIFAQVYVPKVDEATELPVFVLGAGSSGLADACAPSLEDPNVQNWGSYKAYLLSIATRGYLTILPDYAGFSDGDPETIQPYYVSAMAGHVMLDAGRAAFSLFADDATYIDSPATPAQMVFLAGYSQGGQSIFAAKDLWQTYAPELPLAGVVGYAPVTNMQSHMRNLPQFAPYRMYAWHEYYGDVIDLNAIFTDAWLPTLEADVLRLCVVDAAGYFSRSMDELYQPAFAEALRNDTLAEDYPELNALFDLNNPGFVQNDIPALIVQGDQDATIPMPDHEAFVEKYCAAGNRLTDIILEGMNHFHAREVSYRAVIGWMQAVAAGEDVPNVCAGE
jgi:pimeloyl-ACP methyl ester carboxylesterase